MISNSPKPLQIFSIIIVQVNFIETPNQYVKPTIAITGPGANMTQYVQYDSIRSGVGGGGGGVGGGGVLLTINLLLIHLSP